MSNTKILKRKIKVLQIGIGGLYHSGVVSYLYQYYSHIDRNRITFDFLFCRENPLEARMHEEIFADSRFYCLQAFKKAGQSLDIKKCYKGICCVLRAQSYDYVIINTSRLEVNYICMLASGKYNVPVFIAHAHNSTLNYSQRSILSQKGLVFDTIIKFCRNQVVKKADFLFACSRLAGESTFGKDAVKLEKFRIIRNAMPLSEYKFNEGTRNQTRKEFGVGYKTIIYGNVGRMSPEKNLQFLIDIYAILKRTHIDSRLWLIGDGAERSKIEAAVKSAGLSENVRFFGQRDDVGRLMQAMDCFIFTSKNEGLGSVAIEAQAAGLPVYFSDGVPNEVAVTGSAYQLPLSIGPEGWADRILKDTLKCSTRVEANQDVRNAGYDIDVETQKMLDFFESHCAG